MAKMATAVRAQYFGANHAVTDVAAFDDFALRGHFRKAGPATAGIKLVIRLEQQLAARGAVILAGRLRIPVFPREGALRAGFAQDVILFRRQNFAPFFFGALQGKFHGGIGLG